MAGKEGSAGTEALIAPPGHRKFWVKGESSGNVQQVRELRVDCDGDCLLLKVEQTGAACHEGYRTCFFRAATADGAVERIGEPLSDPY
jgi:phosphoribosyl-AMP cyclohydrolase